MNIFIGAFLGTIIGVISCFFITILACCIIVYKDIKKDPKKCDCGCECCKTDCCDGTCCSKCKCKKACLCGNVDCVCNDGKCNSEKCCKKCKCEKCLT